MLSSHRYYGLGFFDVQAKFCRNEYAFWKHNMMLNSQHRHGVIWLILNIQPTSGRGSCLWNRGSKPDSQVSIIVDRMIGGKKHVTQNPAKGRTINEKKAERAMNNTITHNLLATALSNFSPLCKSILELLTGNNLRWLRSHCHSVLCTVHPQRVPRERRHTYGCRTSMPGLWLWAAEISPSQTIWASPQRGLAYLPHSVRTQQRAFCGRDSARAKHAWVLLLRPRAGIATCPP